MISKQYARKLPNYHKLSFSSYEDAEKAATTVASDFPSAIIKRSEDNLSIFFSAFIIPHGYPEKVMAYVTGSHSEAAET